jgi:integrase
MIREDLAAAKIADTDDRGRRLDFYSLRHTCGSNLARAGVPFKLHMELMRHKDVATTMRFYVSLTINDRRAAVEQLAAPGHTKAKKRTA